MTTSGFDGRLASEPYPSTPDLWPIASAARKAGMSARLLEVGIERGDIPVMLRKVGPSNKRFVNATQMQAWLNEKPSDGDNLFA